MMISEEHRALVATAIPPGVKIPEEFWRGLELAIAVFVVMHERRTNKPPRRERDRWQRVEKKTDALAREIRTLKSQTPWREGDLLQPTLTALGKFGLLAEAHCIGNEMLTRRASDTRVLYHAVLDLWCAPFPARKPLDQQTDLGQPLRYSRSTKRGTPGGPLIRFFSACVGPVLGDDAPSPEGIAKIIDRRRHGTLKPKK
jgi:hypothetical protein